LWSSVIGSPEGTDKIDLNFIIYMFCRQRIGLEMALTTEPVRLNKTGPVMTDPADILSTSGTKLIFQMLGMAACIENWTRVMQTVIVAGTALACGWVAPSG
jgi:hypothetical protein